MSDSHDNLDAVRSVVGLFKDADCRLLLHAGDFVAPFTARELEKAGCPVKAVFGNCDGEKTGLAAVEKHLAERNHDLIIFGHTHKAEVRKRGKTLIINPGETGGWLTGRRTAALFDPTTGKADIVAL